MDASDTKYCKDCAHYEQPRCTKWVEFVMRKETCDDWKPKSKPARAEPKEEK